MSKSKYQKPTSLLNNALGKNTCISMNSWTVEAYVAYTPLIDDDTYHNMLALSRREAVVIWWTDFIAVCLRIANYKQNFTFTIKA